MPRAPLALRLALRDLRGGWRGLRIVVVCLALGVASIATVGGLRSAVEGGIRAHGREILGGDLEIGGGRQEIPPGLVHWLTAHGARSSQVWSLRSMLIAPGGDRQLVELRAVDDAWPLVGRAETLPAGTAAADGLLVDPLVLGRLALRTGDRVRLGQAMLRVRAALIHAPDRAATPSLLGPPAQIRMETLGATGLIQPGSMVNHALRVVWPAGTDGPAFIAALQAAFPDNGWRMRDVHDAVPGATRFIDQLAVFLSLVGLSALLVGGIGVATGVRAWLDGRQRSIAILRCLGASGPTVFAVALIEVLLLAGAGIAIGAMFGAALPWAALSVFRDALPVPPELGLYPRSLALAAVFGALTALVFALPPLGRAMRIPGGALFRDAMLPQGGWPPTALLAADAALAAALAWLTIATSPDRRLAEGFCAAALGTLLLFRLGGAGLMAAARGLRGTGSAQVRLGLGNLYRPGNPTALMLMAMGLGLSTLAAIALIQGNVAAQLEGQLPKHAPSFFFIDIQTDQLPGFDKAAHSVAGVSDIAQTPNLVTRVSAVNGVPVEQLHPSPDTAWAMRGDRGLTYAATPPTGTKIVAGQWWPADYRGPPLVSFDANLARGWGVNVGDIITVNLLGRSIPLRIASLRQIDWRAMTMNFAMVASPGLLSSAPQTHLATVRVPVAQEPALLRAVTDALPNVTGIRVSDVLASVGKLLRQIGTALAATGSLTLASGALVLAGAVASGQRRRIQQAVILKSLGATRRQIRAAWLLEFGALGLVAGVLAAVVGSAASYATMHYVMKADWSPLPFRLAITIVGCIAAMMLFGYAGTEVALHAKVAPTLRAQ